MQMWPLFDKVFFAAKHLLTLIFSEGMTSLRRTCSSYNYASFLSVVKELLSGAFNCEHAGCPEGRYEFDCNTEDNGEWLSGHATHGFAATYELIHRHNICYATSVQCIIQNCGECPAGMNMCTMVRID